MPDCISAFLLDIYRASRRMRHEQLRPFVFDALQSVVSFDSAFWFRWAASETSSYIHTWYLHNQPESLLLEYAQDELWREDVMYWKALAAPPGNACRVSYADYTENRMRSFLKRHRQEHVMTIAVVQDVSQIAGGMSLYRNETRDAFSEVDGQALEAVISHLIDAWRENWLQHVVQGASSASAPVDFSIALLTPDFSMSEAQDSFGPLIQCEWPDWRGPWLPDPLRRHFDAGRPGPWFGERIAVYHSPQPNHTTILLARRGHPLDRLPPRKREVALMFAGGASQTEVAQRMNLAPHTVNNYLGNIYQTLALNDKTGLSRLVERLQP